MYTEDDSDNESDFEPIYMQSPSQDDYSDLKPLQDRPLFLQDLIMGLQSDSVDRYTIAMNQGENLIRSQNSNDLL